MPSSSASGRKACSTGSCAGVRARRLPRRPVRRSVVTPSSGRLSASSVRSPTERSRHCGSQPRSRCVWRACCWSSSATYRPRTTITEKRLTIDRGLLSWDLHETRLVRVQNVNSSQTLLERTLGIGTVDFDTAGSAEYDFAFRSVARPHRIVRTVRRPAGPMPATAARAYADRRFCSRSVRPASGDRRGRGPISAGRSSST